MAQIQTVNISSWISEVGSIASTHQSDFRSPTHISHLFLQENNGGCSHLCLAVNKTSKIGSSRCACPKGLVLSFDEKKCTEPIRCEDSLDIGKRQFACANGIACIDPIFRCNGFLDCSDGSDEEGCPSCNNHPNKKQFTCLAPFDQSPVLQQQLICIEEGRVCDGIKDCHMGADEICCADKFRCNSRHCLTSDQLCDGKKVSLVLTHSFDAQT